MKRWLARSQTDFVAGLAVVLPIALSFGVVAWLFGTISAYTDALLFFLPRTWTHSDAGVGGVRWYWSLASLAMTVVGLAVIGRLARNFVGRKCLELVDITLLRVPLLNKIYGTLKQVNEAVHSGNRGSFKKVVLVEYPHPGSYSIGFVTSEESEAALGEMGAGLVSVFVPTTPNPTAGFLLLVPPEKLKPLSMSVADAVKLVVSLGAVTPVSHESRTVAPTRALP